MPELKVNRREYSKRIDAVLAHIQAHLDETLSVEGLSGVANFSPFHFHRQFTAYTGITVTRLIQLLRLRRASRQLVFNPRRAITEIALESGFANAESFSRAFRKQHGQTPSAFRRQPQWQDWQTGPAYSALLRPRGARDMQVEIVNFPETLVAALEHKGPERLVYETTARFIEWRKANGIRPEAGATYGLHYSGPGTLPEDYRLDICVSVAAPIDEDNVFGVVNKTLPAGRFARARHLGSRDYVTAADFLYREWLPDSGEELRDFPLVFHYVNVGPQVKDHEMITDVYLPLV